MKNFKTLIEMAWDISELEPYDSANISTHDVSQMKLNNTNDIYYVKFSNQNLYDNIVDSNIHPIVEYLAYKIYKLFKNKVPEVDLIVKGDVIGLASKATKGVVVSHRDLLKTNNIKEFFATSAFLGNWDWSGTGTAGNIIVDDSSNATLIDPGGSLTFRAQGGRKGDLFKNEVGEVKTLLNPDISQGAIALKGIDVTKSIKDFLKIPWSKIALLLKKENKYINSVLKPLGNNLDKKWKVEFSEIESKLSSRYKSMLEIIKKVT